jgi:branched-chain amino acid transport system substrate-binding protein
MGRYLVDRAVRRLVLVYSNDSAGLETVSAVKETYTGQVLAEIRPSSPGDDFGALMTQVAGARPDALYVCLSGREAVAFLRQAGMQLDRGIQLTGCGWLVEQDVLGPIAGAAPVGAVTGLHWAQALASEENQAFTGGFRKMFGRPADVFAMQGHDTGRVIVEALDGVGGRTDDRLAFMRAISRVRFRSPRGDFRFDSGSNTVINTVYLRQVVDDPVLGYTNRVVSSRPDVVDPGR